MYSSRGNNSYGQQKQQQQQSKPQSYSDHLGPDGVSQLSMASRHSALLGGHSSSGAHYGGQYSSVYGSTALNSALQVPSPSAKGAGPSVLEGRSGYGSTVQDSPGDRLPYAERSSAYSGRDLQTESTVRFADSIAFGRQHQADIYDRLDAAAALRQELLQAQSLQSASVDGSSRQADYLAARAATIRHAGQELLPYGGRMDADLHTLSMLSGTQHAPSILGAAPRRDIEDLVYAHGSANPGYGVSLPPGRAYGASLDSDYPGGILARGGYARLDDRKDDVAYAREIERREEDRRREILRERERERERDRDRERLREREREREWERERERRKERERMLERREKEVRRERTPIRISRDRGRSSSAKAVGRSLRRESTPRAEASHRRHSPVKEKRREYVCKVYTSNLVDTERDYLAMDKRYSRLYISPECSKVVVNWSREDSKLSLNTPISFEHDFVEEETPAEHKSASTKAMADDHVKLESGTTRWKAKMLLMSGLSHNAWEELSSERSYEDRIPHFCNMLRFAFLKDGNSFMAIGGSWDTVDGNDPSIDKSALVQTVLRHTKELTGLDLKHCRRWNPFLEIHYDRVGKDGLFSHKEVTVLYIPDLSDCLPSIDAWRDQWLAHKKAVAERERLHALKREKLREKKEVPKDKETGMTKDVKKDEKTEKKKESGSASKVNGKGKVDTKAKAKEAGKEGDKTVIEKKDDVKKDDVKTVDEGNNSEKKIQTDNAAAGVQTPVSGKKKIIKKVIKKKVVAEKDAPKQSDTNTDVTSEDVVPSAAATPSTVNSSTKKKATKTTPLVKTVKKEDEVKEAECSEEKPKDSDVVGATVKTPVKKKVVKKVAKKKIAAKDAINKDKVANENETGTNIVEQTVASGNQESEVKLEKNESVSEVVPQSVSKEVLNKGESKQVKDEKKAKVEGGSDKNVKSKDEKVRKDKDGKTEPKVKDVKDKKKVDEPPRHPGLILQTRGGKNSRLRSLSLSLDSLLDYIDKDIEESTFELSIFAETFYEMLQYQMGSRILTFLKKLRIKFVAKRNQKKRQREEVSDKKEKEKTSSAKRSSPKRQKTEDVVTEESKPVKTEAVQEDCPVDEKNVVKDENMLVDNAEKMKTEDESEQDEDPEEDPEEDLEEDPEEEYEEEEEDENMADASPKNDAADNEEKAEVEKVDTNVKSENVDEKLKDEQENSKVIVKPDTKSETEKKENSKEGKKKKETPVSINKELLQAFRFFDRNRVGYVRVEDLRLILHALGKSMSHRDVKELVQSALLESNTGRDDRVLYNKLVKMTAV